MATTNISTNATLTPWPVESASEAVIGAIRAAERRWAWRACLASPILAVTAWALAARYLLFVVYLQPVRVDFDLAASLRWPPALLVGFVAFAAPWCWWLSISTQPVRSRWPSAALTAGLLLIAVNVALLHPRVNWFFVEWALVRTPNPSFARNTLMWEQRNFEHSEPQNVSLPLVRLVGSSQIYQGTDLAVLAKQSPGVRWEKNCLAGFGPLQYLWLEGFLFSPRPRIIVCWLSEFDFFREDDLPVSRLRWGATPAGLQRLDAVFEEPIVDHSARVQPLLAGRNWSPSVRDQWSLRGDLADLGVAATVPAWRLRDHFRRVVFHYWEDVSHPPSVSPDGPQLAVSAEMEEAKTSLRNNVGRKRFVAANFRAFAHFARDCQHQGVTLLVCEGVTHPEAAAVYDPLYRVETRERLRQMAAEIGFRYLDEEHHPYFTADDFADPYHLNEAGRNRFSRFLASLLPIELARTE